MLTSGFRWKIKRRPNKYCGSTPRKKLERAISSKCLKHSQPKNVRRQNSTVSPIDSSKSSVDQLPFVQCWVPYSIEKSKEDNKHNKIQDFQQTILEKWERAVCSVTNRLKQEQFLYTKTLCQIIVTTYIVLFWKWINFKICHEMSQITREKFFKF